MCAQALFWSRRDHSRAIKGALVVLWVIDSVGTVAAFANLWQYGITHWGDDDFLRQQYWPMIAYVVTSSLAGAIVQAVLASRYWALSRNIPACLTIAVCWTAHLGGGFVSASYIAKYPGYNDRGKLTVPVTIYLIGAVVTDTLIASLLVYKLSLARAKVVSFEASNLTKPLERLIRTSIETGAATALLAVAALASYLADKASNISPCFGELLGRTYTLTLLFILLQRRTIGDDVKGRPTRRRFGFPRAAGGSPPNGSSAGVGKGGSSSGSTSHEGPRRKSTRGPPRPIKVTTHKSVRFVSPVPTPLELQEFDRSEVGSRAALSPSLFTLGSFSDRGEDVDGVEKGEFGEG